MIQTFDMTAEITETRKISITLPQNTPIGLVKLHVQITSVNETQSHTLGDLLNSDFFGMWQDRLDIKDSRLFAKELRQTAWDRAN